MNDTDPLLLDLADVRGLFELDALMDEFGDTAAPSIDPAWHWETVWTSASTMQVAIPLQLKRCDLSDDVLATCVRDIRNAAKLPLNEGFLGGLRFLLEVAEQEARNRIARAARHKTNPMEHPACQDADLAAEVEAVCGPGRQRGRDVWFSCHWHDDRTPSLHVDVERRLWHCFGCQRGGGVLAWRKAIREGRP